MTPDLFEPTEIVGIGLTPVTVLTPTRDCRGRYMETIDQAEIDAEAARLRARGFSYREIGVRMGCSHQAASDRVKRALAAVPVEAVEELRAIHGQRLELLLRKAERILATDHVVVSHGKIIRDDDGRPLIDDGPKLQAIAQLRFLSESQRKLDGADMPLRVEQKHTHEITTPLDTEIRSMIERMQHGEHEPAGA